MRLRNFLPRPVADAADPESNGRSWLTGVLVYLLLFFLFRAVIADLNRVPSGSMQPTLLPGDRIGVNKLAHGLRVPFTNYWLAQWSSPRRGEVVVFDAPGDGKRCVKRVAGVPGDQVQMRDGWVTVPPDHYFLRGDNHDRSYDSRHYGCVEGWRIHGRAEAVVFSLDRPQWYRPRWQRFFRAVP